MFDSDNNSTSASPFQDHGKRKPANSIKGYTRAVRRKLYFLFAMLIVVIILMKEARKPERWLWMGFESNAVAGSAFELGSEQPPKVIGTLQEPATAAGLLPSATAQDTSLRDDDSSRDLFWRNFWDGLATEDKTGLVQLIQASQQPINERTIEPADFEILADAIQRAQPKTAGTFSRQWQKSIAPGFISLATGNDITVGQQTAIGHVFESLDPLILESLDDFTSPGLKSDLPAWHRFWGRVLGESATKPCELVTPVQLVAQPDSWRFSPIRMEGKLVSGRSRKAGEYGPLRKQGQWYEWWIGNTYGASDLWCVYTATKPDSIEVTDRFTEFDRKINVTGYFYKIRSYVDAQSNANHCPLILARSISIEQTANPIAAASWKPSLPVLAGSVVGVILLALAIAMLIYRSDHVRRRQPGGTHRQSIESHLKSLSENADIKSTSEKLEELS